MDDSDPQLVPGNDEANKAITEVLDDSVWRKATLVDGKAYWATESAGGIGEPVVSGNFKIRHMGDYVLMALIDDDDPTDHEARAKAIKKANDDRVAAFIGDVTDRLLAFHQGRTEPESGHIGAFKAFTKDTANTIIDKIMQAVVDLQAERGRTVDSQALRTNLDVEIVRAVLFSRFTEFLPDLLVDGALVTDVHGYIDDDFDNPGPEMKEVHQAISDGLLSLRHRELDAVRQKVMRSNVESLLPSLSAMNVGKDDEGYDSDSSRVSQDHCRISPYYPACADECWLRSIHHEKPAGEGEVAKSPEITPIQIYESLEPDCIRILTIHPGPRHAKVSCNLRIHSMSVLTGENSEQSNFPFQALSYTWGDPTPCHAIECNEKDFLVAQNLYHALRYLRLVDQPVSFWIDAICINQNDLAEKSQQIRHMYRIYQLATQVVVWLGTHCDSSQLAMRSIKHLADLDKRRALLRRDHGRECIQSLKQVVASLDNLFQRQWFERSWIRQEVAAARKVVVRCGDDEIPWGRLKRISSCMWRLQEKILSSVSENADAAHPPTLTDEFRSIPLRFLKRKLFAGQSLLSDTGDVRSLWYYHAGGFLDHLMVSRAFQATNPRDKVYAVLGIADVPIESEETPDPQVTDGLKMRVDYGASVSEVYQYTAKYIINRDRNLDVLCILSTHRDENSIDLPTWTPDWRVPTTSFPLYTNWDYFSYKFGAAGFTECETQDQDNVGMLVVKGFPLTEITELVPVAITSIPHPPEEPTGSGETLDYAKHNRQLAETRTGNAIVPVQTEVDDEVWVLWGCKLPIVLRLVAQIEETNQLFCAVVGPCYVPTYMWGQGMKMFLELREEPQEILLV